MPHGPCVTAATLAAAVSLFAADRSGVVTIWQGEDMELESDESVVVEVLRQTQVRSWLRAAADSESLLLDVTVGVAMLTVATFLVRRSVRRLVGLLQLEQPREPLRALRSRQPVTLALDRS